MQWKILRILQTKENNNYGKYKRFNKGNYR